MSARRWIALEVVPFLVAVAAVIASVAMRSGSMAAAAIWLNPNAALTVDIPSGASPRLYAFRANPAADTLLRLSTDNADFAFAAEIRDGQGGLVASLDGNRLLDARLTIGPSQAVYQIAVGAASAHHPGNVVLALGAPAAAAPSPPAPVCGLIAAGNAPARILSAPQAQSALIGELPQTGLLMAQGRLRGGWYAVDAAGKSGWIAASSVRLQGACNTLPVVLDPTIPVAPKDGEPHTLYVDRDGGGSLSGAVGAPNGDTLDTFWVAVLNLYDQPPANYREFHLMLTCTGVGVENLRWGSPQSPTHRCGERLTMPFLYNAARQPLVALIPAGSEQSYVSYGLSAVSGSAD
jgi:hypothetical protein